MKTAQLLNYACDRWTPGEGQGLVQRGGRYVNEFRTYPDPTAQPSGSFTFMVLGDYGTGMRKSTPKPHRHSSKHDV